MPELQCILISIYIVTRLDCIAFFIYETLYIRFRRPQSQHNKFKELEAFSKDYIDCTEHTYEEAMH